MTYEWVDAVALGWEGNKRVEGRTAVSGEE